jgi:hypothetical protein
MDSNMATDENNEVGMDVTVCVPKKRITLERKSIIIVKTERILFWLWSFFCIIKSAPQRITE